MVLGVELGYEMKLIALYARCDQFQGIDVGEKLLIGGVVKNKRFHLEDVVKFNFKECDVCSRPLYGEQCLTRHDGKSIRITNFWRVVYRRGKKYFLEQNNFVISTYLTSGDFYYNILKHGEIDDIFQISGWQTDQGLIIKNILAV